MPRASICHFIIVEYCWSVYLDPWSTYVLASQGLASTLLDDQIWFQNTQIFTSSLVQ